MGEKDLRQELRTLLMSYVGEAEEKKDSVTEEDVELEIIVAEACHIEQEILDYAAEHPEAPFWDFLKLNKPGLFGVTQEELLEDDEDD